LSYSIFGNDVHMNEKCKHCGKAKGNHQAIHLNCPLPGRGSFKSFHVSQWFEAKATRKSKKKKDTFTL
jgi:hypothetical protein